MRKFEHNYLVFDQIGLEKVLCMACGNPIKSRSEIKSQLDPSVIIREVSKHSDYREIPVIISDGKLAFIMVCDGCKFVEIGEQEAKDISEQLKKALKSQLEFEGKLPDLIEAILKEKNYEVSRKAEVHEVTTALRGA